MDNRQGPAASAVRVHTLPARKAWPAAALALGCAWVGSFIALHYPLVPPLLLVLFAAVVLLAFRFPHAWLVVVPTLLPIIGLAPWTGWITFEEFDVLVLGVAAGGYAWLAWRGTEQRRSPTGSLGPQHRGARLVWLLVGLFAASLLAAMFRGFADAGGFEFGWYQGYREPMNSVRIAKPFFAALLLLPLWAAADRRAPEVAASRLSFGLMLGLLGASLAAVWERQAYVGLLDFSSDYRTTAMFWEMHVGGAALDGFLALTVPFAVSELLSAKSRARWMLAAAVTGLAIYACLTTFSRGVYVAVPLGLAVMLLIRTAQRRGIAPSPASANDRGAVARVVLVAAFAAAAWWMFPTSGYRGMLALMGAVAGLLPLAAQVGAATRQQKFVGFGLGLALSVGSVAIAIRFPKAVYLLYATGAGLAMAALALQRLQIARRSRWQTTSFALGGYIWMVTGIGLISLHWGGEPALLRALPPIATLLLAPFLVSGVHDRAWPSSARWLAHTLGATLLAGGVVAVFGAGGYMSNRFDATSTNYSERLAHWKQGYWMLKDGDELMLGKGLGRFAESYALAADSDRRPGDYRIHFEDGNGYLVMAAGTHLLDYGEMLQVTQRVSRPVGQPIVTLAVRASQPVNLHLWVCTKHLLYVGNCMGKQVAVSAKPGVWQSLQVQLEGHALPVGAWYAPRLAAFAMALDSPGRQIDVDNIALIDADGRDLLSNGDFSSDMSRWFFTSDRNHLPWHIKNMALAVLFDQGWPGLGLLTLLVGGALWRVSFGHARTHLLSPYLAGGLIGFTAVGAFDSLLDVPRVGFVFYFHLLVALTLRSRATGPATCQVVATSAGEPA